MHKFNTQKLSENVKLMGWMEYDCMKAGVRDPHLIEESLAALSFVNFNGNNKNYRNYAEFLSSFYFKFHTSFRCNIIARGDEIVLQLTEWKYLVFLFPLWSQIVHHAVDSFEYFSATFCSQKGVCCLTSMNHTLEIVQFSLGRSTLLVFMIYTTITTKVFEWLGASLLTTLVLQSHHSSRTWTRTIYFCYNWVTLKKYVSFLFHFMFFCFVLSEKVSIGGNYWQSGSRIT